MEDTKTKKPTVIALSIGNSIGLHSGMLQKAECQLLRKKPI